MDVDLLFYFSKNKILFVTFSYFYFLNIRCKILKTYINSFKKCNIFYYLLLCSCSHVECTRE